MEMRRLTYTNKISKSKLLNVANVLNLSSGSSLELASLSYLKSIGNALEIVWIAELWLASCGICLRVLGKEAVFPLSKILVKRIICLFRNCIFLNLTGVFYFLVNRSGIKVIDVYNHTIFDSIKVQSPHIFFHLGNGITFLVHEDESDIIWFWTISFLDILFKRKDGWVRVNSELWNLEGWEVVFEIDFDHCGFDFIILS